MRVQVISVEKVIRPKILMERDRRRKLFMEACILETIVEVKDRLLAESASEQRIIGNSSLPTTSIVYLFFIVTT